ncbi:deoxyribose-phosphate aldolase [Conchiformibius kuhniae]|uniref:Deoxyribose-phosphate aldolase n=1 Tax=Conchiformibius kuhniae TaxID=211502 RepID=A0A8T9MV67_9NEIS|nr:deoxyribose-phosphate aldolase [Conchiformibius kuhniae]
MENQEIIALLDLTSLNDSDTAQTVRALCRRAAAHGVAAVCVYPQFVAAAKRELADCPHIALATVVNFPSGADAPEAVAAQTRQALQDGANEIDWVFPYRDFALGRHAQAQARTAEMAALCRAAGAKLKVILETGALEAADIRAAADAALRLGADFLKTSTGKIPQGATPEAAAILLEAIARHGGTAGIKLSGGVRDAATAAAYVRQARAVFGADWTTPAHFRIGASALLDDLSDGG